MLSRFEEDPECSQPVDDQPDGTVCNVTTIITYGRPGTPMQPWGVAGGGPKNDQSIQDLVAFLRTIQLKPADIKAHGDEEPRRGAFDEPEDGLPAVHDVPVRAGSGREGDAEDRHRRARRRAHRAAEGARSTPDATDAAAHRGVQRDHRRRSRPIRRKVNRDAGGRRAARSSTAPHDREDRRRPRTRGRKEWASRRANVSDGQLLFEANCARCHTAGWSTFNSAVPPDQPGGLDGVGRPGGGGGNGGGIGFNLRNNDEDRRFGNDAVGRIRSPGRRSSSAGSVPNKGYGNIGIGSGRMPGFTNMLTPNQIGEVVSYERYCLETSTFLAAQPMCETENRTARLRPPPRRRIKAAG